MLARETAVGVGGVVIAVIARIVDIGYGVPGEAFLKHGRSHDRSGRNRIVQSQTGAGRHRL